MGKKKKEGGGLMERWSLVSFLGCLEDETQNRP